MTNINFSIVSDIIIYKEIYFNMRYNATMWEVFEEYKYCYGSDNTNFYYNNELISSNDSPWSLNMFDSCIIFAVNHS